MLTKGNNSHEGRREQGRGWNGHFLGFRARENCEEMHVIPAWLVRSNLDDPRKIPYLLVWKDERDGEVKEAVRLTCHAAKYSGYVQMKRFDGTASQWRSGDIPGLPLLPDTAPLRLRLGMGQFFGMVKQSQAN